MRTFLQRFDVRVSIGYCVGAVLWILFSDTLLYVLFRGDAPLLATLRLMKGWFFVAVTTVMLFTVVNAEQEKRDRVERSLKNEVDERTAALTALRQSEDRFATIFHGSPVATGILRVDDGRFVDVNDALVALFGYSREELIGRTSLEVGLWADPEKRAAIAVAVSDAGSARHLELQGRTKSGQTVHLLASSRLIDLGNTLHFVSMFYDVSQQRKLEEQVQYQALLLANVSDAVISADTDFNIQSWNPAAEIIYGWTAAEVIGRPAAALLQPHFEDLTRAEVLAQLHANGRWQGQVAHQRKDGSRIYLLASTSYVYDMIGRHIGVVSVNRDITDLLTAQQERQEAAELRIEIQKQAELMRLKESFISVVSHEFRTPLTVITASAELMLNYCDKMPLERRVKHLNVILEQARFMAALLEDVLTINQARAGRLDFNPVPLDLVTYFQEMIERIRGVDNDKHQFLFTFEGDLSHVPVDAKLLQHILVNLLSNAVKYSPNGGKVRLEVARQADEIVLRVTDQGIGIPAESLPQLYEPFFRAHNTGTIGGTGLGMAIAKESVDLHKGTIHYESEVGVGTTVTVRLPAV